MIAQTHIRAISHTWWTASTSETANHPNSLCFQAYTIENNQVALTEWPAVDPLVGKKSSAYAHLFPNKPPHTPPHDSTRSTAGN
ncbi:hypothetical protein EV647_7023 [Kribbella sp. VKM Ac-2566]|nr:hypothetical protein EV647_7023 [Kribbella sp. VKM Ac-2566]